MYSLEAEAQVEMNSNAMARNLIVNRLGNYVRYDDLSKVATYGYCPNSIHCTPTPNVSAL